MIDRTHQLPVARQCQVLSLARSTAYYRAREISETDLALMRRMDELHLEHPFAGSRMLRDLLQREGQQVGRLHVATLMKRMGNRCLIKILQIKYQRLVATQKPLVRNETTVFHYDQTGKLIGVGSTFRI